MGIESKAVPLQPRRSYVKVNGQLHTPAVLTPGKRRRGACNRRLNGSVSLPLFFFTLWRIEKPPVRAGDRTTVLRLLFHGLWTLETPEEF